jgi:hypothetical protein
MRGKSGWIPTASCVLLCARYTPCAPCRIARFVFRSRRHPIGPVIRTLTNWRTAGGPLLQFIDLFVPAFLAFIEDRVIPATHRRSDRFDCHDRGWIAARTILKPHGLRPVRQLGCRNFTHDQRLVLMQEREVSRYRIIHLMGCSSFDLHQIKTGHCEQATPTSPGCEHAERPPNRDGLKTGLGVT